MMLIFTVILVALAFEYINGFHDTANSIATVVSTKVLTPREAVVLAASTNLLGAMAGTAVAKTITTGIVRFPRPHPDLGLHHLRVDRSHRLESDHVVARVALQFEPRPDRGAVRRGARGIPQQLARHHLVATK